MDIEKLGQAQSLIEVMTLTADIVKKMTEKIDANDPRGALREFITFGENLKAPELEFQMMEWAKGMRQIVIDEMKNAKTEFETL